MAFHIDIQDARLRDALAALQAGIENMGPVLRPLGEDITERAKARFGTATAPDGAPWAPNKPSTLERYVAGFSANFFKKKGGLTKAGAAKLANKRPLAGHSGDLARQITYRVEGNALVVQATPKYAAMQQFGGTKAQFPNLWGDIPARPFLPVMKDGTLYPTEQQQMVSAIEDYIAGLLA
jgi:phage gpG-like protein